ncbi:MAG: hypothetical protein IPM34_14395 [Saprospiraceae bacterium]|nr:hypothetical protein [Saprospiraceae bacterium]
MGIIKVLLYSLILMVSCKSDSKQEAAKSKKPLTIENLQGSWASKPGGPAELRFENDMIYFVEDEQSFQYVITGDSIQFELEFATFWYKVILTGDDEMDFSTPQLSAKYVRLKH